MGGGRGARDRGRRAGLEPARGRRGLRRHGACGSWASWPRIERDGDRIVCGGGATLAAIVKRATGVGPLRDRVRLRDPRHRRRRGAHERGRLRRRAARRARSGRRGRRGRRAAGRPGELEHDATGTRTWPRARWSPRWRCGCGRTIPAASARPSPTCSAAAARPSRRRCARSGRCGRTRDGALGAGQMLEACGLKGFTLGGARISPVHANFIENVGRRPVGGRDRA